MVLRIIREAREFVVLVSPFNSFWTHLKNAMHEAIQRNVRITLIYQSDSYVGGDGVAWLMAEGGKVYRHPNLHAKIYLNESWAMLSSMNLTMNSSRNSMDIGMLVQRTDEAYTDLLAYARRLANLATPVKNGTADSATGALQSEESTPASNDSLKTRLRSGEVSRTVLRTAKAWVTRGRCIRCQKIIPYDADNPLCEADYAIWNQYQNKSYPEKFCHKCGTPSSTTFRQPLCHSCCS